MPTDDVRDGQGSGSGADLWDESARAEEARRPERLRLAGLALLVGLADLLFFGQEPALSLAIFAAALIVAVRLLCGPWARARGEFTTGGLLILAVLPVVELVQGLSVLILSVGVVILVVRLVLGESAEIWAVRQGAFRFVAHYPWLAAHGARDGAQELARARTGRAPLGRLVRAWLLPGAAGVLLLGLLLAANPVLSLWAERLGEVPPDPGPFLRHTAFWAVAALLVWPFLAVARDRDWLGQPGMTLSQPSTPGWVNDESVRNALVVFNLLLGVQTALDLGFLWGGAALPEGVTYAQYAQRGAYPLVATALLAGGFALVSRPFAEGRPGLRALLGLWLGQNVLLVASSLMRLDLYVDTFGLTRLRLAAAVWMALVAGGLCLTAWQVWRGRSNGWLLGRVAGMALGVLYLCCFVNGAGVIATTNLDRYERTGRLDRGYLCSLGPGAGPAILENEALTRQVLCEPWQRLSLQARTPRDWREWGFRNWRLRRYAEAAGTAGESRF